MAVERRMAKLGHRSCFDLAYPFPGQLEMDANFVQGPGLTAVEPEAQLKDHPFALVQNTKQFGDLIGQQLRGGRVEGRYGRAVFDHVTEFGVTV